MESRSVTIGQGWMWLAGGVRLFLRSPVIWIVLLLILFVAMKVVNVIGVLALVAVLLMPVFLAGLMDGCKAIEDGRELRVAHLLNGFQKNAAQLVTIGGISLVGNLIIAMIVFAIGGEAIATMAKTLAKSPTLTPQIAEQMQAVTMAVIKALLVGTAASLPLMMALWFAPPLIYFHDVKPIEAMKLSFIACLKNALPMLLYGLIVLVGLMTLVPIGIRLGHYDLGLWLMAPALVPSIYVSYKDIFNAGRAVPADGDNAFLK